MGETTAGLFAGVAVGDEAALGGLLAHFEHRLRVLARANLAKYPRVADLCETDDIMQGATARLIRAIRQLRPDTPARFWGLVAEHLHRELVDLHRKGYGPHGDGRNVYANRPADPERHDAVIGGQPDPATGPLTSLAEDEFHDAVRGLPEPEREVVRLHLYCGLTHRAVGEAIGVSESTAKRAWYDALERLEAVLKRFGEVPPPPG